MSAIRTFDDFAEGRTAILADRGATRTAPPAALTSRIAAQWGEPLTPEQVVARIVAEVRAGGDAALRSLAERIDGVALGPIAVSAAEIDDAFRATPDSVVAALRFAAERVEACAREQLRADWLNESMGYGQIVRPIERVGLYAPGGTAVYPSTVIMTAVPARVAGVADITLASPAGPDGRVHPATLVAARIAGVDRVIRLGGAAAVAALAYGTESVGRVDKICGPGNLFVALAKRHVAGDVAIDLEAGPTETVLIADGSADPDTCAADLIAQAEHDTLAQAILITTSPSLAAQVAGALERQLAGLGRAAIAGASLAARGAIIVAPDLDAAISLANAYAPEHLCLLVADPAALLPQVRNAGGVFLGEASCEALGDYIAGPSHVMPTGGAARFAGPLSVDDFIKVISVVSLSATQAERLAPFAATLGRAEGLGGHAAAAERRIPR